jgi:hypothetical protein
MVENRPVILFGGIEIGMAKRSAVAIDYFSGGDLSLFVPLVEPRHLAAKIQTPAGTVPRRFEVIRYDEDQMLSLVSGEHPPGYLASSPHRVAQKPRERPGNTICEPGLSRSRWRRRDLRIGVFPFLHF